MAKSDQYCIVLGALCAWREARGEGREGMRAVLHVLNNRCKAGYYRGDWITNITAKNQFSSLSVPGDPMVTTWPREDDPDFAVALTLSSTIYLGSDPDNTEGSLEYRNPKTATSKWFEDAIASGHIKKTVTIGNHEFYH